MEHNSNQSPSQVQEKRAETQRLTAIKTAVDSVYHRLSVQQRTFVIYYILWSNATKAAKKAGYVYPDRQGSRLLKNKKVTAAIDAYFATAEMETAELLARINEQARGEYGRYFYMELDGTLTIDTQRILDDGKGYLIKNVDWKGKDADRQVIEFYPANEAQDRLARIRGLYKDRLDLTTKEKEIKPGATAEELASLLAQARKELEGWKPGEAAEDD